MRSENPGARVSMNAISSSIVTASCLHRGATLWAGAVGVDPRLERCDELLVRERRLRALAARVPAPLHERVVRDVIEELREISIAGLRGILELRAQRGERAAHEDLVRGGQPPVRRAGRTT